MPVDPELQALLKQVADEAARKAVRETLTLIGIDLSDPFELQADMRHLRRFRENVETVARKGVIAAMGAAILGTCIFAWVAVTQNLWMGK